MSLQEEIQLAVESGDVNRVRNLVTQSSQDAEEFSFDWNIREADRRRQEQLFDVNIIFASAVKSGNEEITELISSLRPPPSARYIDEKGRRFLHYACETGSLKIVKKLVSMGSIVNTTDQDGWTPTMIAASKGFADIVEYLIIKGGRLNRARLKESGESILHLAVKGGHYDAVNVLTQHRVDLNYQTPADKEAMTPLHQAVLCENPEIVKLICSSGADVLKCDSAGRSPFHSAAFKGLVDMVQAFIDVGVDTELLDAKQRTPLHQAVMSKSFEVVSCLLIHGANVSAADETGYQPIHEACAVEKDNIVKILLEYGASVNAESNTKSTPLMEACLAGAADVIETLIVEGADINAADVNKRTALHKALISAKDMTIKENISLQLIAAGAIISPVDKDRYTPLHNVVFQCVVNSKQHLEAIKIFVKFGANLTPEVQQPRGQVDIFSPGFTLQSLSNFRNSPMCWLTWRGFYDAARFLVYAGWDLAKENWLDLPGKDPEHEAFLAWLRQMVSEPYSLSLLCRNRIRNRLSDLSGGREIITKISTLPVPNRVKDFLNLSDI